MLYRIRNVWRVNQVQWSAVKAVFNALQENMCRLTDCRVCHVQFVLARNTYKMATSAKYIETRYVRNVEQTRQALERTWRHVIHAHPGIIRWGVRFRASGAIQIPVPSGSTRSARTRRGPARSVLA